MFYQMNSVERIRYYSLNIPSESSNSVEKLKLYEDAAINGDIQMSPAISVDE